MTLLVMSQNLSIEFDNAQKNHNERVEASKPKPDEPATAENTDNADAPLFPALEIKLNPIPDLPQLEELELPPKREPIVIPPFTRSEVDFDALEKELEKPKEEEKKEDAAFPFINVEVDESEHEKHDTMVFTNVDDDEKDDKAFPYLDIFSDPSDEEHTADESDAGDQSEAMISMLEKEKVGIQYTPFTTLSIHLTVLIHSQIAALMKLELPDEVDKALNRKKIKIPKKKGEKREMERDLRKLDYGLRNCDPEQRKYVKIAVLKYRDLLRDTYKRYCIIGGIVQCVKGFDPHEMWVCHSVSPCLGDRNWLNEKGWVAMYHGMHHFTFFFVL